MNSVGAVQMTSGPDPRENLIALGAQLEQLAKQGARLVVTPENSIVFGSKQDYHQHAEPIGQGVFQQTLFDLARQYNIWLVVGSFPIKVETGVTTTTLVINECGELVAHYDKLHMFDVDVDDQHSRYRESETFVAGDQLTVVDTPIGKLGLTICYDLRFPALFNQLRDKGAEIITVPAAFTATTGKAHWEPLIRARAIENQCWIIACGQTGVHPCGRETWGHSMIVDPWGKICTQLTAEVGGIVDNIDHQLTQTVRAKMPMGKQARFQQQLNKGIE